jgi:hypothetical protein
MLAELDRQEAELERIKAWQRAEAARLAGDAADEASPAPARSLSDAYYGRNRKSEDR